MSFFRKIISYVLVAILPIMILCISCNLVLRAPDIYQYSFKATEVFAELGIYVSEDEMGEFFSDYMLFSTDEFQINPDPQDPDSLLFSKNDQNAMESLRGFLNVCAGVGIVLLIAVFAICYYFRKKDFKLVLRKRFIASVAVFLFIIGVTTILYNIPDALSAIKVFIAGAQLDEMDVLHILLSDSYIKTFLIVWDVAAMIFMVITGYIIWHITKPKRMFW